MTPPRHRLLPAVLGLVVFALLLITATLIINTSFMLYDDEGYVLLSYREFIAGKRLYDDIFTQYGPFPYVYHGIVSLALPSPLTHMQGRGLTAFHWVGSALLAGGLVFRLTRSTLSGLLGCLVTFGLLWQMNSEPAHPGSLICLILASYAYVSVTAFQAQHWRLLAIATGTTASLLVLTKINVGALFIAGATAAALLVTDWPVRWRRPACLLAGLGLLAVPWGLMGTRLNEPWVLILAIQFSIAVVGLLWITPTHRAEWVRPVPPRCWWAALAALVGGGIIICGVVLLRGTSPEALLRTVLLDPLRHPAHLMIPLRWPALVWPVTLACAAVVALAGLELRRHGELSRPTRLAVIALRLIALAVFILNTRDLLTTPGVGAFTRYVLPLLPVFLIPLRKDGGRQPLLWAALLALPQILHIYPVAGSQMGWGTFLFVPLLVVGLHDIWANPDLPFPRLRRWAPRLLLVVGLVQVALLFQTGWERYTTSKPLGLPGAEGIRTESHSRLILRLMTLNASVHADVLFSRPGMFSYNIWSGVPTPTTKNATHWFWLLDDSEQAKIVARLQSTPRSAVITSRPLDDFLASIGISTAGPLQSHIEGAYKSLFDRNGFHFYVPQDSRAAPFGLTDFYLPPTSAAPGTPLMLQFLTAINGRPATAQLKEISHPWAIRLTYNTPRSRVTLEPINSQGDAFGPPIELSAAGDLHGLFRVRIYTPAAPPPEQLRHVVLELLDADGAVLSEALF
jgi:hypothetical protein